MIEAAPARSHRCVLRADDDSREDIMEFRLTYAGPLKAASSGTKRVSDKHTIRRHFHPQLRRMWYSHPWLKGARLTDPISGSSRSNPLLVDHLAEQYERSGYKFVPIVTPQLTVKCRLDILFLRAGAPGSAIRSGDLDNRLKTLFDALRIPENKNELGGYDAPSNDETPFFCLLSDDKLITHVSVETDSLLEPTTEDASDSDARLIIRVELKPYDLGWHNINLT